MMIKIQEIDFPFDSRITYNEFYNYDPVNSFNAEDSAKYLSDDLLQCTFPMDNLVIDLGWYGDTTSNKGEYRIYIIMHENWDFPFNIIHSKSTEEITDLLNKILQYYTRIETQTEPDIV